MSHFKLINIKEKIRLKLLIFRPFCFYIKKTLPKILCKRLRKSEESGILLIVKSHEALSWREALILR